jgi:hypothetical protein
MFCAALGQLPIVVRSKAILGQDRLHRGPAKSQGVGSSECGFWNFGLQFESARVYHIIAKDLTSFSLVRF